MVSLYLFLVAEQEYPQLLLARGPVRPLPVLIARVKYSLHLHLKASSPLRSSAFPVLNMALSRHMDQTLGGMHLSGCSQSVPPGWSLRSSHAYPFRKWLKDLAMWFATTILEPHQIGPAIAMRLDGVPRQLADASAKKPSDVSNHPLAKFRGHLNSHRLCGRPHPTCCIHLRLGFRYGRTHSSPKIGTMYP